MIHNATIRRILDATNIDNVVMEFITLRKPESNTSIVVKGNSGGVTLQCWLCHTFYND